MFKRTLRQLAAFNSIVFLIIFIIFGMVVYGYVAHRIFEKVDHAMRFRAAGFEIINGRAKSPPRGRLLYDPPIMLLVRDAQGNVVRNYPRLDADLEQLGKLAATVERGKIQTVTIEDHVYRILVQPYTRDEKMLVTDAGAAKITDITVVSIVDSEAALLENLLIIIGSGMVIGVLIIVLAGYSLARRAMIPIQNAWEQQQQFVADASHELRTPLAVVTSNAELMLRHPGHTIEDESIRLTNIVREVRRMTKLVANLLTLARTDANQTELQLGPVSVNEVINAIAEQFVPLAEMQGLTLTTTVPEPLELVADRERLDQLLIILLDNAMKYTPAPGQITLGALKQGGNILLTVEDTGAGIPADDLPQIFARFYRGDKARSRQQGGTGLGLSIAKWIVERHGGKIKVASEVGVGTKFSISLPLKQLKNR